MMIMEEINRLRQLNAMLDRSGLQEFIYEDWVEATANLLQDVSAHLPCGDNATKLTTAFNNEVGSAEVIQHFRVRWLPPLATRGF
jgi:ubiquitin thioesterase protein OTUB1